MLTSLGIFRGWSYVRHECQAVPLYSLSELEHQVVSKLAVMWIPNTQLAAVVSLICQQGHVPSVVGVFWMLLWRVFDLFDQTLDWVRAEMGWPFDMQQ